jgi:hypothetical protein
VQNSGRHVRFLNSVETIAFYCITNQVNCSLRLLRGGVTSLVMVVVMMVNVRMLVVVFFGYDLYTEGIQGKFCQLGS